MPLSKVDKYNTNESMQCSLSYWHGQIKLFIVLLFMYKPAKAGSLSSLSADEYASVVVPVSMFSGPTFTESLPVK